jgi:hypothetical protein
MPQSIHTLTTPTSYHQLQLLFILKKLVSHAAKPNSNFQLPNPHNYRLTQIPLGLPPVSEPKTIQKTFLSRSRPRELPSSRPPHRSYDLISDCTYQPHTFLPTINNTLRALIINSMRKARTSRTYAKMWCARRSDSAAFGTAMAVRSECMRWLGRHDPEG